MQKLNTKTSNIETQVDLITTVISNMKAQTDVRTSILLTGDPGVGKTSFVKMLGKLMGMRIVVLEVPHITEEHIINIPFIVINPTSDAEQHKDVKGKIDSDYKIVLSNSALYSDLTKFSPISEKQLLDEIYKDKNNAHLAKIMIELGGSESELPKSIVNLRKKFSTIFFLDEFFRQNSARISNMLRTILNGEIGLHKMPPHVYTIYASNMNDSGIEKVHSNQDFQHVELKAASKDEWFSWLVAKYEHDKRVKLDHKVLDIFYENLKDEHISNNDFDADVRTSPRRWEQLLLYISSSLPVKSEEDAKHLLANVHINFKHYATGEKSKILKPVIKALLESIKKTSKITLKAEDTAPAKEWRKTLKHQIEQKMKLGEARSYIPVISGPPGIGKTSEIFQLGLDPDINMPVISIDVSTLNSEDTTGIPVSKTVSSDTIEIKFSSSKLIDIINRKAKEAKADFIETLKTQKRTDDIEKYNKQEWKFIIFFDELNRNNASVFNSLRKLILEKKFSDSEMLPKGSIIVAAINPTGGGTDKLTKHLLDVSDIIEAEPSWDSVKNYIENKVKLSELDFPEIKKVSISVFHGFLDQFTREIGQKGDRQFYIDVGSDQPVYISPREMVALYVNLTHNLDSTYGRTDTSTKERMEKAREKFIKTIYESLSHTLMSVLKKHDVESPEFLHNVKDWVIHNTSIEKLFFKTAELMVSLSKIVAPYMKPKHKGHLGEDIDFINFVDNTEPQDLKVELEKVFDEEITKIEDIMDDTHGKKELTKNQIAHIGEEIPKLEAVVREFVLALKVHKFSNDKVEIVSDVLTEKVIKILNEIKDFEDLEKFLDKTNTIHSLLKQLKK